MLKEHPSSTNSTTRRVGLSKKTDMYNRVTSRKTNWMQLRNVPASKVLALKSITFCERELRGPLSTRQHNSKTRNTRWLHWNVKSRIKSATTLGMTLANCPESESCLRFSITKLEYYSTAAFHTLAGNSTILKELTYLNKEVLSTKTVLSSPFPYNLGTEPV